STLFSFQIPLYNLEPIYDVLQRHVSVVIGILTLMHCTLFEACPYNCKCTKYKLFCRDSTIKSLPQGNSTTTLLSMENDMLTTMNKTVISESGLRKLTTLKLINMHITHIQSRTFSYLRKLKSLTINCNNITDLQSGAFLGLANLIQLDLSRNKIANLSSGVFDGLGGLSNIRFLGEGAFQDLKSIELIDVQNNKIVNISAGVFGAICDGDFTLTCPKLTRLSQFCNISTALGTLTRLYLSHNRITSIHEHAFLGCNKLQVLDLSYNKIQVLDFLYTPQLTGLEFSHNANVSRISNSTFRCTSKLTDIKFWSTNVKVMDSKTFKNLKHLKTVILPKTEFDCSLLEIWRWLNTLSIHIENSSSDTDFYLPNLKCSNSTREDSSPNEYIYFITYIEPTVIIFIFLSGFLGNGFLLFLIFCHSDMRNKNNACVAHLAFADILSLLLNLPLSYWEILHVKWNLGDTACKMFIMSKDLTVALVACSVIALTYERFLVVQSFNNLKMSQSGSANPVASIGAIWMYALSTSIPSYLQATVITRCYSSPPGSDDYIKIIWTCQLLLNSFFPVLTIIFLNILTAYTLKTSIREVPGEKRKHQRHENRNTVANVVTVLSVVFTLSSIPNFLLRTLVSFSIWTSEDVLWYSFVTYCLFFSHAIFNPIALFIMGSKYKFHLKQYLNFFIKESKPIPAPVDIDKKLKSAGIVLLKLGLILEGSQQEYDVDILNFPEDITAIDERKRLHYNDMEVLCACLKLEYPKRCFRQSQEEDPEPDGWTKVTATFCSVIQLFQSPMRHRFDVLILDYIILSPSNRLDNQLWGTSSLDSAKLLVIYRAVSLDGELNMTITPDELSIAEKETLNKNGYPAAG
ncbi:hypothetical protein C0J52_10108, partial [Blattella germanica]